MHSDALRRMWLATFRGDIKCGNMFITKITHNKTIRYNVNLLASSVFLLLPIFVFDHTCVFTNLPYSLNCISVLLITQPVCFVWVVVMGVTSLSVFQSTSLFSK